MIISTPEWIKFFPFEKPRPQQEEAINFALNSFAEGKRIVVLEMGTGTGKSPLSLTISKYLNSFPQQEYGTYFLTSQKILQDQYVKDFGFPKGNLVSLKSSTNYKCEFYKELNCREARTLLRQERNFQDPFFQHCSQKCIYATEKNKFLQQQESITNFPFFLLARKQLDRRNLLVIDEAHLIEDVLSDFVEVSISERYCETRLNTKMPEFPISENDARSWMKDDVLTKIEDQIEELKKMIKVMDQVAHNKFLIRVSDQIKHLDVMENLKGKLENFLLSAKKENWVMNLIPATETKSRRIEFKSIDVSQFAGDFLFSYADKILMMSATILNLDIFAQSLGLKKEDIAFISRESPFPVENKPIFYFSCGRMSKNEINKNLKNLSDTINVLLEQHSDEKGIIHTRSYIISNYLRKNLKNSRLIFHDDKNREEMLKKHVSSKKATVLVSPSMSEGVDLHDDLSRFQIICKLPFPFLGDKVILRKKELRKNWYEFMTAKSLIQSVGRSIRNENDHAVTYILDGCWESFFEKNKDLFPKSFKESLKI